MKTKATSRRPARSQKKARPAAEVLYLYAVSRTPERLAPKIVAEGIDGAANIEALRCDGLLCWISRVSKAEFADRLNDNLQNLEWLAAAGLRHQRAVAEISSDLATLPARFGTVFRSQEKLEQHVKERRADLEVAFQRVANADEWGVKVFALANPMPPLKARPVSGSDYLKRKAELLQPSRAADEEVHEFVSELAQIAVASSPGGKASAGQPGLLWHGSFLVRRKDRKKLEGALAKFAERWSNRRRIDCSGPWPPYSFVGDAHGD